MIQYHLLNAGVMELADVLDSKSSGSDTVSVRPRSPAPKKTADEKSFCGLFYPSRRLGISSTVRLYGITFMCMASRQGAFSAT